MELKVWVDGIQRVICGVTESSTCQDVVYALAHATGQIGRFTLVEKWRNSERLLAPNEQPLKVLMKWGEYANDVHFVMRRSQTDAKAHGSGNHQFGQNNKRQHDFYPSLPSSCIDQNSKPPINKEIKKSLTFSCGHSSSGNTENSSPNIVNSNSLLKIEQPAASRNAKNRDGRSRQDLPKGVVRGVPQRPKDNKIVPKDSSLVSKPERPKNPPPYDEAVSRSTNRFTPSHLTITSPVKQYSQDEESPSSKRPHLSDRIDVLSCSDKINSLCQPYNTQINFQDQQMTDHSVDYGIKSHDISYHNSNISHLASQEKSGNSPEKILLSTCINFPEEQKIKLKRNVKEKYDDGSIPNQQKHHITPQNNCDVLPDDLNADPQYQDLLRLVSLQREKLENQQSELTQYDAEIVYWEEKLQEQETKLSLLQEEVCHLELTQHEQEGELVQLDRRPLGEEVELGRQEERTLRSELTLARSQLANCETELLQCRQRIRLLLEDIAEEKRLRSRREELETKEREEQENHLQSQVDCLQQQLTEKAQESENRKNAADEFKKELQGLEFKLSEKQKETQKLMEDIRTANLYSLSLTPADDGKFANEGNFYNRAGSTRKIIGSPRQLENAVPTNKNPHGVWV